MGTLQVTLFGSVHVSYDNQPNELKISHSIQSLLAFILLNRHRTFPREVLAALFWGEKSQGKASGSLNTNLWRLRNLLEPKGILPGTYLLSNHDGEVGFNRESPFWLDVAVFENQYDHLHSTSVDSVSPSEVADIEFVLQLYKGDLLEGFYEDWALRERERLRSMYLEGLGYLLQYYKFSHRYEKGLAYGRLILELDPLREEIHREMMHLYNANGQRNYALRQYADLQKILDAELGIRPMSETQALYRQIANDNPGLEDVYFPDDSLNYQQTHQRLQHSLDLIDQLKEQVSGVLRRIEAVAEKHDLR